MAEVAYLSISKLFLVADSVYIGQLRRLVLGSDLISIVGEAETVVAVTAKVVALAPDTVLMDSDMLQTSVSETTKALEDRGYSGLVVIISRNTDQLASALEAGAAGYLLKSSPSEEVVSVLLSAERDGFAFGAAVMETPEGMRMAIRHMARRPRTRNRPGESGKAQNVTTAAGRTEEEPSTSTDAVASVVEVVVSGRANLRSVLNLHDSLRGVANVKLDQTAGSRGGDTMFTAIFDKLVNPVQLLGSLPSVESVSEEPRTGPTDDDPGRIRSLSELPEFSSSPLIVRRYRLTFKEPD